MTTLLILGGLAIVAIILIALWINRDPGVPDSASNTRNEKNALVLADEQEPVQAPQQTLLIPKVSTAELRYQKAIEASQASAARIEARKTTRQNAASPTRPVSGAPSFRSSGPAYPVHNHLHHNNDSVLDELLEPVDNLDLLMMTAFASDGSANENGIEQNNNNGYVVDAPQEAPTQDAGNSSFSAFSLPEPTPAPAPVYEPYTPPSYSPPAPSPSPSSDWGSSYSSGSSDSGSSYSSGSSSDYSSSSSSDSSSSSSSDSGGGGSWD